MSGEPLDYNKTFQVPFGTYVQANNEATAYNSMEPRTIDAIYLRPLPIRQGGHELMDLRTGQKITRKTVTPIPLPDWVKRRVEGMAKRQGVKRLKFGNPRDSDEFTGVDSDSDSNDESYSSESSDSDDDRDEDIGGRISSRELDDITSDAQWIDNEPVEVETVEEEIEDNENQEADDEVGELPNQESPENENDEDDSLDERTTASAMSTESQSRYSYKRTRRS